MTGRVIIQLLVCLVFSFLTSESYPFEPKVVFIDVGQGDAALIIPEEGFQILIDGGPGSELLESLGRHIPIWDRTIDLVVLTHPHADHLNGLIEVSRRYEIGAVIHNPTCKFSLQPRLAGRVVGGGLFGGSGRDGDWVLNILHPDFSNKRDDYCDGSSNINNASVVVRFDYKGKSFLFMGDAEKELESKLLNNSLIENVDVLKAGHHCSKTSTTERFLDLVNPSIAICSVGERNMYGHPSPETIEKFEHRGIKYLLTSQEGDIIINL